MSALLTVLATVWKVPALRWPALVLAGMLALWAYVEIAEWRVGNEAVEEAAQETKDDMEDLKKPCVFACLPLCTQILQFA